MLKVPDLKTNADKRSLGFLDIPLGSQESFTYDSTQSLMDYDVVIWNPVRLQKIYEHANADFSRSNKFLQDVKRRDADFLEFLKAGGFLVVLLPPPFHINYLVGGQVVRKKVSDLIPAGFPLEAAKGGKMDFTGKSLQLKSFFEGLSDSFEYQSFISSIAPDNSFLVARNSSRVVGGTIKIESGTVLLIPSLKFDVSYIQTASRQTSEPFIKLVECVIQLHSASLPKSKEQQEVPNWVKEVVLPREKEQLILVENIESEISVLKGSLEDGKKALHDIQKDKVLLFGKGELLAQKVIEIFEELGFEAEAGPEGRDDIILSYNGTPAVGEIKGTKGSAAEKYGAQLEKWASRYFDENGAQAKPILIVNGYCEVHPSQRIDPVFPHQMHAYCKSRNHCLVSTVQLLNMTLEARKGPENAKKMASVLMSTAGPVDGFGWT